MKKKTSGKLKKELDKVFSKYIRKKYAKNGMVSCYTCEVIKRIEEMQCGHFISRSYLATRFSEDNCRPQCVGCNVFGGGKGVTFGANLERDLGRGTISRLYKEAQKIVKDYPYEKEIERYKKLVSSSL